MKQRIIKKTTFKRVAFLSSLTMLACTNNVSAQSTDAVEEPGIVVEQLLDTSSATGLPQTPLPLEQVKSFTEVFIRIKNSYVEPVSDEQLLEYAINGMLNGLDPHSTYLNNESYQELDEGRTGKFGGLGMEVVLEDGFVRVVAPIDDTPASKAGIQSGDVIIRIDGEPLSGGDLRRSTDKMRGEPGTPITLTIARKGLAEPFDVELKRAIIRVKSVKRERLSDRIGYLRVTQFQSSTAESFRKELKMLRGLDEFSGLILDLRNNPGGLLTSAISISDAFLTDGIIVSTKGRIEGGDAEFKATAVDLLEGKPIIVLINSGSASASEIVAGALQDHKRALILGTDSFGKGSVQTVMNNSNGTGLKLTTARYYTPSGASIQAAGIIPDVVVEQRKFVDPESSFKRLKENDLPGHLENDAKPTATKTTSKVSDLLANDYQLNEAFNLLNGIILFNK